MNKLGTKIAEKRKRLGMTQIEFAEKMHVTRQTVSRWEAGTVMPDVEKIGEIADILGTIPYEILTSVPRRIERIIVRK